MAGTGFDQLTTRRDTQDLWLRRLIAFVIDSIMVGIVATIIGFAVALPFFGFNRSFFDFGWIWFGGFAQLFIVAYFVLAETGWGTTIGKSVMGLRVVRADGARPDLEAAFIRNISKISSVLVFLDVVVGLVMQGDGRQKFTDRLAGTRVESVRESSQQLR